MFFSTTKFNKHLCKGKSVQCEYCDSGPFNTTLSLSQHLTIHKKDYILKNCSKCSSAFPTKWELETHSQKHLDSTLATHVCDLCGAAFSKKARLYYHKFSHNSNEKRNFLLNVYWYVSKRLIKVIKLIFFSNSIAAHLCSQCGSTFKTKQQLAAHAIVHSDHKPYACPHCPARYARNQGLKRHLDQHNGSTKFACDLCPAILSSHISWRTHRSLHNRFKIIIFIFNSNDWTCLTKKIFCVFRNRAL